MNKDTLEGKWKETKGEIQKKWGKLTNDDMDVVKGSSTKLIGKLQKRYGWTKDKAEKEVGNIKDKFK